MLTYLRGGVLPARKTSRRDPILPTIEVHQLVIPMFALSDAWCVSSACIINKMTSSVKHRLFVVSLFLPINDFPLIVNVTRARCAKG
jgi:hypothetical protein